jgi:hypothetical protein
MLPKILDDHLSGEVITAECDGGEVSSKGIGNPSFSDHKEPKFAEGGGWVAARAPIAPGKSRKGWLVVLMDGKPSEKCKVGIDMAALGGGVVSFKPDEI